MNNMQAQKLHIGDRQNHDVPLGEQGVRRLEKAVLQDLLTLCRRAYRDAAEPQRILDRGLDEPVNTLCPAHKGFH
jgi:hypothetical protein